MTEFSYGTDNERRGNWAPKTAALAAGSRLEKELAAGPKALAKMVLRLSGLSPAVVCSMRSRPGRLAVSTPPLETMRSFSFGWVGLILLRNLGLAVAVYGAWHMWLYVWRKQGTAFKYSRAWPKEKASGFLFGNQTYDNMFHTLASGVPIWTAYEVLLLWAYANGVAPMISFAEHPVWFFAMFFVVPFIHEAGFYCAHRLLHVSPLYEIAHKLHHRNISPVRGRACRCTRSSMRSISRRSCCSSSFPRTRST